MHRTLAALAAALGDLDVAVHLGGQRLHLTRTGTAWALALTPATA